MDQTLPEPLRLCTKCDPPAFKPRSEFSKCAKNADGLNHYCRACMAKYAHATRDRHNKKLKARNKAHPEILRAQHLKSKYGITQNDYDEMYLAQEGKCSICGKEEKLEVDHNHDTGNVRGLLCKSCNMTLAHDANWMRAALAYLERAGEG